MAIIAPTAEHLVTTTPTSYINVFSWGVEKNSNISHLKHGIETEYKSIGKYIIEQNTEAQETIMSPCYFFYLAKKSKRNDPKFGQGGAVVIKVIDSSVSNDKIRALIAANRIVLSAGGTFENIMTHSTKAAEFNDCYVTDENKSFKWVVLKLKDKNEVKFINYAIQHFVILEDEDYDLSDLLTFRKISNQKPIPGYVQTSLTVTTVTTTNAKDKPATTTSSGSKGSKKKEEGCLIS